MSHWYPAETQEYSLQHFKKKTNLVTAQTSVNKEIKQAPFQTKPKKNQ
jgi:hypothetical protein